MRVVWIKRPIPNHGKLKTVRRMIRHIGIIRRHAGLCLPEIPLRRAASADSCH